MQALSEKTGYIINNLQLETCIKPITENRKQGVNHAKKRTKYSIRNKRKSNFNPAFLISSFKHLSGLNQCYPAKPDSSGRGNLVSYFLTLDGGGLR